MPTAWRSRVVAGLGVVLGAWAAGTGCLTPQAATNLADAPQRPPVIRMAGPDSEDQSSELTLTPRSVLEWTAEPAKGSSPPLSGKVTVAADGSIDLGPYGTLKVGGKTPKEASNLIAKHLGRYVKSPHVKLKAMIPTGDAAPPPAAVQPAGLTTRSPAHAADEPPPLSTPGEATRLKAVPRGRPPAKPSPITRIGYEEPAGPSIFGQDRAEPIPQPKPADQNNQKPGEKEEDLPAPTPLPPVPPPPHGHDGGVEVVGPPPTELTKQAMPRYVIEPPDVLAVQYPLPTDLESFPQAVNFQALVKPDGTITLGIYGDVYVGGMTLDQARYAVSQKLMERVKNFDYRKLNVDVLQFNSKFYYVITDLAGNGVNMERLPVTGNETVLDALTQIQLRGISPVSDKCHIYVARRVPGPGSKSQMMHVDWKGTAKYGGTATNFQVFPGDRIYICADAWRLTNTWVDKVIAPIERIMGFTLLTTQTIHAIQNKTGGSGSGSGSGVLTPGF